MCLALLWKDAVRGPGEEIKTRKDKKEDNRPLSEVIMIEEDEELNFVPERILEKRGTKYLIRWKGMDEASDIVWLSKSMTQRGSAIHLMMTEKDAEEETLRAVHVKLLTRRRLCERRQ